MVEDKVNPKDKWKFNEEVTDCFDNMLSRSIPQYEIMREVVATISKRFVNLSSIVIDIGCSRGESIARIMDDGARFYGLEYSEPMIKAAQERFKDNNNVQIIQHDLREGIPLTVPKADLIISTLTVQFTPIEYRQWIIQSIYDQLKTGGAFIFVEKVLGSNAFVNRIMVETYLDMKRDNGYSNDQIERKKLSLEGVLVPVTAKFNEEFLKDAGFKNIDCIWRWMNFAGWIAIK